MYFLSNDGKLFSCRLRLQSFGINTGTHSYSTGFAAFAVYELSEGIEYADDAIPSRSRKIRQIQNNSWRRSSRLSLRSCKCH